VVTIDTEILRRGRWQRLKQDSVGLIVGFIATRRRITLSRGGGNKGRLRQTKEWAAFVAHLSTCERCKKVGRCETGSYLLRRADDAKHNTATGFSKGMTPPLLRLRLKGERLVASCLKCKGPMVRCGIQSDGIQRIICTSCNVRLQVAYSRVTARKSNKYRLAAYLLGAGKSVREVETMTGVPKKTVSDIRKDVMRNSDVFCGCGQEAGHKGWCSFRYDRSPARQAFMTRWGRPPLELNIDTINLLRSQGKPVREIAALLGVNRNTITCRLAEQRAAGRRLPWFCVGMFNTRAALAIRRYWLMTSPMPSGEAFSEAMTELWKAARVSGCPSCGAVRKYSNGQCRRCLTMRLVIQRAELAIAGTIRAFIYEAQQPLRDLVDSLSEKRGLRPAQRLQMLVEKVSGTRNIQTES